VFVRVRVCVCVCVCVLMCQSERWPELLGLIYPQGAPQQLCLCPLFGCVYPIDQHQTHANVSTLSESRHAAQKVCTYNLMDSLATTGCSCQNRDHRAP